MNESSSKKMLPLTREDAEALRDRIKNCREGIKTRGDELGELLYEFLARNGPSVLGIDRTRLRKKLGEKMGVHRSTVYRTFDWVEMEIELKQPHRAINAFMARTMKDKVRKDAWSRVLERARRDKGSDGKITAQDVLATAAELDCFKRPPVRETEVEGSESSADGDEHSKTAQTTKRSPAKVKRSGQADRDQRVASGSDSDDAAMNSDPVARVLDRLRPNRVLRKAVISLLDSFDNRWGLVRDLAGLGTKGRSDLHKRLEELG